MLHCQPCGHARFHIVHRWLKRHQGTKATEVFDQTKEDVGIDLLSGVSQLVLVFFWTSDQYLTMLPASLVMMGWLRTDIAEKLRRLTRLNVSQYPPRR